MHHFNADGPDGLRDHWTSGPPCRLSPAQLGELAGIVEAGPDVKRDGVVRWRQVDLRAVIEKRFGVAYGLRAVANVLHRIGFSPISAPPRHPAQDPETIVTLKKTSLRRQAPTPGNCRNTRPSKSGFASRPFGSG